MGRIYSTNAWKLIFFKDYIYSNTAIGAWIKWTLALGVMAMKKYSTFSKAPGWYSVIYKTHIGVEVLFFYRYSEVYSTTPANWTDFSS